MTPELDPVEVRVLGALLEKDVTTPEYYPLTLNALVAACNQKNNRDPVVTYDDETVNDALVRLREKRLSGEFHGAGSRVKKYTHRLPETFNLGRRELALMDVLMLRGPQTLNELLIRSERLHKFNDVDEIESCLQGLADRGMVTKVARASGTKDGYAHLLSGEPVVGGTPSSLAEAGSASLTARVTALEEEVRELRRQWEDFRRQFE